MRLKVKPGKTNITDLERTVSGSGKTWEILGAPSRQTESDPDGPDTVCFCVQAITQEI